MAGLFVGWRWLEVDTQRQSDSRLAKKGKGETLHGWYQAEMVSVDAESELNVES